MSEPANPAALSFRAAVDGRHWPEVGRQAIGWSAFLQIDLVAVSVDNHAGRLHDPAGDARCTPLICRQGARCGMVPRSMARLAPQLEEGLSSGLDPTRRLRSCRQTPCAGAGHAFAPASLYGRACRRTGNIPAQQGLTKSSAGALIGGIDVWSSYQRVAHGMATQSGKPHSKRFRPRSDIHAFALLAGDELWLSPFPASAYDRNQPPLNETGSGRCRRQEVLGMT